MSRCNTTNVALTCGALSSLADRPKSQLDAWVEDSQPHERLILGIDTLRNAKKVEEFFEDVKANVEMGPTDRKCGVAREVFGRQSGETEGHH